MPAILTGILQVHGSVCVIEKLHDVLYIQKEGVRWGEQLTYNGLKSEKRTENPAANPGGFDNWQKGYVQLDTSKCNERLPRQYVHNPLSVHPPGEASPIC